MNRQKKRDLISLGDKAPSWLLGKVFLCPPNVGSVCELLKVILAESSADALLFWDVSNPLPAREFLDKLLEEQIQVWHGGLKMGMHGLPHIIDFVSPCWMLNCDVPSVAASTSWRLSLKACLIRTDVLRKMGGIYQEFQSLEAAGLEMGHRFITRGVLMRYIPEMSRALSPHPIPEISFEDEIRFIFFRFGKFWMRWALSRSAISGYVKAPTAFNAWKKVKMEARPLVPQPYCHMNHCQTISGTPKVSVLIPTLKRYGYLRQLLPQLAGQTVKPFEIIIVDQTPEIKRDHKIGEDFRHLPLRIIYQDQPGQCASRNEGLVLAKGEYILFLDDDDEIFHDFIEKHLQNMSRFKTRVSSGVAYERGAGDLPENFSFTRASDVFPTNNTMIERCVLEKSGLFDLAFNRKQRADGDLGMRIYMSGEEMVLNPEVLVIHHHSSQGGLREHKARKETYAASRSSVWTRRLLSDSEIYLGMRYFSKRQVREMIWINIFSAFSLHGGIIQKIIKFFISAFQLPGTLWAVRKSYLSAKLMTKTYPKIQAYKIK